MPDIGDDTDMVTVYVKHDEHARWADAKGEDQSMSGFIKERVRSDLKPFDASVEPDETNQELREQRNDLKAEVDHLRDRISKLEERLYHSDSAELERYVERNPGTDFDAITSHLRATVPERAQSHVTVMEGEELRVNPNGLYFPREDAEGAEQEV